MNSKKNIFTILTPLFMAMVCACFVNDDANAAARATVSRGTPVAAARKSVATTVKETVSENIVEKQAEAEPIAVENKSNKFDEVISDTGAKYSSDSDDTFAESIRKQRAALEASEKSDTFNTQQRNALNTGHSECDAGLRKCMKATCGEDFTKCALDGDTDFGNKLNRCKKDLKCSGEEFTLFTKEIKADRDMNVRLASYTSVVNCGNNYNKCIAGECGSNYTKCLGKTAADAAIKKCANIATECREYDSGLSARFGTAIGKLRENAETEIKEGEQRMYALRDLMRNQCEHLGAAFDERSFDCVYTVNFFAGTNQTTPIASRKAYAGDSFVCMQEWFGTNVTTFKENAYRETRAQTGATSAMLGSGVGMATGLASSGAFKRAAETQKAKKEADKSNTAKAAGENTSDKKVSDKSSKEPEEKETKTFKEKTIKNADGTSSHETTSTGNGIKTVTKTTTDSDGNIKGPIKSTSSFNTKKADAGSVNIELNTGNSNKKD